MQCTAHRGDGLQCTRRAIAGGTVCPTHGGSAPQVKEAARIRILKLVDPALATLARAVRPRKGKWEPCSTEITAARDILDRAGLAATQQLDVTSGGKSWVDVLREEQEKRERASQPPAE